MSDTPSERDSWEMHDEATGFMSAVYGKQRVRMAAVALGNGDLLVISPGVPTSEARFAALEKIGRPRFLLAPNHFHNGGIATWHARYPDAIVAAHPLALPRLRKQVPGVPFEDLTRLEAALPSHLRLFGPQMAKQGETWLSIRMATGNAWFVTDGIINEKRMAGGLLGAAFRLIGFRAQLMTNPLFKRLFLRDKAAYKTWVCGQLDADQPVLFVPSHGVPLIGPEVTGELRAVTLAA